MNKLSIIYIAAALILFSCGNKENEKNISRVDSLYNVVSVLEQQVLLMDTSDFKARMNYNENKLVFIQENYRDTASKEDAFLLSDIIAVRRSFSKLMRQREEVIDKLLYSKGQLTDLKKDLSNNLVLENSFNEYFSAESVAITNLSNTIEGLVKWSQGTVTRHENMKPKIEAFIQKNITE